MVQSDLEKRAHEVRGRLDAFRETEALAGVGVDELFTGMKSACARVDAGRPETSTADRLNPQHWGYGLYIYFRDRILIKSTILPVTDTNPLSRLLRVEVSMIETRPLLYLTLERTSPATAEWRFEDGRIDVEAFFFGCLERYANLWTGTSTNIESDRKTL